MNTLMEFDSTKYAQERVRKREREREMCKVTSYSRKVAKGTNMRP